MQPSTSFLPSEHDVFRNRHRIHEHELLVDHADAGCDRFTRLVPSKLAAVEKDGAAIRANHATLVRPWGTTMKAASSGPIAVPTFPPT